MDSQCKKLHKQLRWQSDEELPRTNFPTGISSLAKMTASERSGVLLMILIVVCVDNVHFAMRKDTQKKVKKGETGYLVDTMGQLLTRNVVKHISLLLQFEAFLKSERVPLECIPVVKLFVKLLMSMLIKVFPRKKGTGHNTIKNHLVSHHMIDDIYRFGSGENYNSGPMELSHIQNIKQPG